MLYPTLNQPFMFLLLICAGLASGIIFDLLNLVCNLVREDRFSKIFFDFLSVLLAFSLVFIVNLLFNYGQFRVYVIIVFILSLFTERAISKFLWTKLVEKCYSKISKRRKARGEQRKAG